MNARVFRSQQGMELLVATDIPTSDIGNKALTTPHYKSSLPTG